MREWDEVYHVRGTVEERAEKIAADFAKNTPVMRKLTLDLVYASFPPGHPPPMPVMELLRRALDLPDDHDVGGWPTIAGKRDPRGGPDHVARNIAMAIDSDYSEKNDKLMSQHELQRQVNAALGRHGDMRKAIRRWRKDPNYWGPPNYAPPRKK
jgi:hypothetical protein